MVKNTLSLFWRATWKYKTLFVWGEVGATLFVLSNDILPPLIISQIIGKVAQAQSQSLVFHDFWPLIWLFIAVRIAHLVSGRLMMQTYIRYEPAVVRDLEIMSFKKLQSHSMAFFADNFSGALVAKVNRLTTAYSQTVDGVIGGLTMLLRQFLASFVVLLFVSPVIALIFLVWAILFCISVVYLHRRKISYSRAASEAQTKVTARLADAIMNVLTTRSFAQSKQEIKAFSELSDGRRAARLASSIKGEYVRIYKVVANSVLSLVTLLVCIHLGLNGTASIASIILIQLYMFRLIDQIWNFGKVMDNLEEAVSDASEMTEILLTPDEVTDPVSPEPPRMHEGAISFNKVGFQYEEATTHHKLLRNFTISIPAGQKVGLVGPSGSGKTTLTKLLLRFMDVQSGEILIDGQNTAAVLQDDLRSVISYVPQDPLLFHRSIADNIAYAHPGVSRAEVVAAAKKAYAAEFIESLPDGYDTIVGERGVKLSGGQRQRVAIARAMLKNAPITIFDEATSSLDSVSERYITQALDDLMDKRTTLVIAHRLSTIRRLDRILVMDKGRIVEDGSHAELLKQGGLYARLWQHQTGEFIGED